MNQFFIASFMVMLIHRTKGNRDCYCWSEQSKQFEFVEAQDDIKLLSSCEVLSDICKTDVENYLIEVELPPKLLTYNSTDLQINLWVKVKESDICNINENNNTEWRKHSKISSMHNLQQHLELYTCKTTKTIIPVVTLEYIFSGCYFLKIINKDGCVYISQPTFISSNYTKNRLVDNIQILEPRCGKSQECNISIKMNSTCITNPPSIKTILRTDNGINNCTKDCVDLTTETMVNRTVDNHHYLRDNPRTNYKCNNNNTLTPCNEVLNITWKCTYPQETGSITEYTCEYKGLPPGKYTYNYLLLGENTRCNENSLWTTTNAACTAYINFEIPEHKRSSATNLNVVPEDERSDYIIISLVVVALVVFILLGFCTFLYKQYCKSEYQHQETLELSCQYLQTEELSLLDTKDILIIYARDCELFATMIDSLKLLLCSVDNNVCVHDINVHNETMCLDPENWIRSKISSTKMKFILFLNPCGSSIFENQLIIANPSKIAYKDGKWHDSLFIYAVKQLEHTKTISYTNLFVVDTGVCNTSVFDHINPDTRFVMPNSIHMLLQHVFPNVSCFNDPSLEKFMDSCCSYNKYCEDNLDYTNNILKMK